MQLEIHQDFTRKLILPISGHILCMVIPTWARYRQYFLGVENISNGKKCTEVWFDEFRLMNLNDQAGYAANGRVDLKLADFGTLYLSGSVMSVGFGSIDQSINERALSSTTQLNAATNLELGKLFPKSAGISIPFYGSISRNVSTPEYDPYDLDIKLQDKINLAPASERDSIEQEALDVTRISSFNFTNVQKT